MQQQGFQQGPEPWWVTWSRRAGEMATETSRRIADGSLFGARELWGNKAEILPWIRDEFSPAENARRIYQAPQRVNALLSSPVDERNLADEAIYGLFPGVDQALAAREIQEGVGSGRVGMTLFGMAGMGLPGSFGGAFRKMSHTTGEWPGGNPVPRRGRLHRMVFENDKYANGQVEVVVRQDGDELYVDWVGARQDLVHNADPADVEFEDLLPQMSVSDQREMRAHLAREFPGAQRISFHRMGKENPDRTMTRAQALGRIEDPAVPGRASLRPRELEGDQLAQASLFGQVRQSRLQGAGGAYEPVESWRNVGDGIRAQRVFTPTQTFREGMQGVQRAAPNIAELEQNPAMVRRFHDAISRSKAEGKFGASVYVYPEDEYQGMRLFLTEDGKAGFALKEDGDVVSVFSDNGAGDALMELALDQGGRKLDAFDTVLPDFYRRHGFQESSALPWLEEVAPEDWDKGTFGKFNQGEPDVTFMHYNPRSPVGPRAPVERYSNDYMEAVRKQEHDVGLFGPMPAQRTARQLPASTGFGFWAGGQAPAVRQFKDQPPGMGGGVTMDFQRFGENIGYGTRNRDGVPGMLLTPGNTGWEFGDKIPKALLSSRLPLRETFGVQGGLFGEENISRLRGLLERGIKNGGHLWYDWSPLYSRMADEAGPELAEQMGGLWSQAFSAYSPRTMVAPNLERGSELYRRGIRGILQPGLGPVGNPSTIFNHKGRPFNYAPGHDDFPLGLGHINTMSAHAPAAEDILSGATASGHFISPEMMGGLASRRKTTAFGHNNYGNLWPTTVDTHNNMAMTGRKGSPGSNREYSALDRLNRHIGEPYGLLGGPAQSGIWDGAADITGVADRRPPVGMFDELVVRAARERGIDPQQMMSDFIWGRDNLFTRRFPGGRFYR